MPITIHDVHGWDAIQPDEAIRLQHEIAPRLVTDQPLDLTAIRLVAGVDVSVKDNISRAAVVVLRFPALTIVETATAARPTPFPYIPGLLTFREGAVILDAMRQISATPDVFIFDGMGIMHPRRLGIAAHMGLFLDTPTVGCGKTRLLGTHDPLPAERGAWVPLRYYGQTLGVVLRTRTNVKPVYVSPGNHADIPTARDLVLACAPRFRLPEPVRAAHNAAGAPPDDSPDDA